jgi:hypothetical protein
MLPALGKTEENSMEQHHPTVKDLFDTGLAYELPGSLVRTYYGEHEEMQGIVTKTMQDHIGNQWLEIMSANHGLCVYPAYSHSIPYFIEILSRA